MIAAAILLATAPQVASASLGFSGATLSVKSVDDPRRRGTAHRRLTLTLPSGKSRSIELKDGGGFARNNALNLYHREQDSFLLVSERDCVAVDPIKGALNQCHRSLACGPSRTYVGRFDWMNGFDPPHGRFGLKWRFLPAYDASESGGC
jgi:hypothetical protein